MKKLFALLFLALLFTQCDNESSECNVSATVRDLTGLDGCRFVFELEDGTSLEPAGGDSTNDPIYGFEFVDGKRVKISYRKTGGASICMVGPVVQITCIKEISETAE